MPSEQTLTVRWGRMHALRYLTPGLVGLVFSGGLLVLELPETWRVVGLVLGVPSVLLVVGLSPFLLRPWTALTLDKEQIRLHRVLRPDIAVRCSDVARAEITHVFRVGPVLFLYLRSDAPGSRFAPADHGVILEDLGLRPHELAALLEQYCCDLSRIRVDY